MPKVAVVTDSTACLLPEVVQAHGLLVVPMQVVVGGSAYDDGVDPETSPDRIAEALRDRVPVSTSRPSPAVVLEAYRRAAAQGAEEVVSVHVSGEVSATCESAMLAARDAPVPVHTVDTRQVGAGTGYAALSAAAAVAAGATGEEAADAARDRAARVVSLFCVDTLEHLRRGGRVGAAAALFGSALAVKPILQVEDGRICPLEKVRTSGRALARLEELAVEAAGSAPVEVTVCHLADAERAAALAASLDSRLAAGLGGGAVAVTEIPAVLGAHVGPGSVGVAVAPR